MHQVGNYCMVNFDIVLCVLEHNELSSLTIRLVGLKVAPPGALLKSHFNVLPYYRSLSFDDFFNDAVYNGLVIN